MCQDFISEKNYFYHNANHIERKLVFKSIDYSIQETSQYN
jgi:hypothetical protein